MTTMLPGKGFGKLMVIAAAFVFLATDCARAAARQTSAPNFLIILADDCTYNDLASYGGQNARTPNIDRLAKEGLTFNHAYVSMSMCQPCRSELYTGQYPLRNGCSWNHSASRPGTRSLPTYLKARGYRVGIAGKIDVTPKDCYPFEEVPGFERNCVDNPTKPHTLNGVREFMSRKAGEPFCLVVALVEPHVPWVMGDPSQYPPGKIKLPLNIADTKRTRDDFGRYLAEITYMDGQVGEVLETLKSAGIETNTLVLFSSEQGSQFPGNKWTCWDTGLHTGLIARWPGRIAAGKRTDAMVGYLDVVPTVLELAGGNATEDATMFDGRSFAPVLRGEKETHRKFVFGTHNNFPEGPAYPSRTVTDGKWRYVRNLTPNEIYIQKYIMGTQGGGELNNPYWGTWMFSSEEKSENYRLVKRYMSRPSEEFYRTSEDPYEMHNVASEPQFAEIKSRLSSELDHWMAEQGDPGAPLDSTEALEAARNGNHKFFPKK
ncbi:MAG TPA: sulfatase [Candidatus Dormibacteraeota bacterium]|nr:sulfatase [Candidatus Dormibacteraeota bacterium]